MIVITANRGGARRRTYPEPLARACTIRGKFLLRSPISSPGPCPTSRLLPKLWISLTPIRTLDVDAHVNFLSLLWYHIYIQVESVEPVEQLALAAATHKKRRAAKFLPSLHIKRHTLPTTIPVNATTTTTPTVATPPLSSPTASSTTVQYALPMKRHTAPGNIQQTQVQQERTPQVGSVGRLVNMVKAVTLLKV